MDHQAGRRSLSRGGIDGASPSARSAYKGTSTPGRASTAAWEGYADEKIILRIQPSPAALDRFDEMVRWLR
ncbi:hypothetical protein [Luteimonas panaciterrae]|uniref:hypothetical protein n=1 Tax=Luteimonas panaciterrae TaxID=363885 RepID=UPI001CFAB61E|nr:hypothetical protein [Luteimonas panaciterrae]